MAMPSEMAKRPPKATTQRSSRWLLWSAVLVGSAAAAFLALPALAGIPARLVEGCGNWIAAAGALELLSAVGFIALFKLVFAAPISWRAGIPAALRALGASTILPGGGLIGPTIGAWSTSTEKPSVSQITRSTITFVILTNAPAAIALAALGTLLWLGLASGPHQTALTILPALIAVGLLTATWLVGHSSGRRPPPPHPGVFSRPFANPAMAIRDGVSEARALITAGNWKLSGALAYYAFDNAVLWAAFHAYGHTPALSVIMMGYLVGSLAGALPLPAGLGAVDGGLIAALVLYGAPAAPAAAAVLLYRGISLGVPALLGAIGCTCRTTAYRRLRLDRRRAPVVDPTSATRRATAELATAHTNRRQPYTPPASTSTSASTTSNRSAFCLRRESFWRQAVFDK
jgi:uncharacterized membrane protein YbhN (UPF0104 family)